MQSLAIWAIVGAICGGLYAYLYEHLASKEELERIGRAMPANSSTIVAFVQAADPERVLSSATSFTPTSASVAAVSSTLSVGLYGDAAKRTDAAPLASAEVSPSDATQTTAAALSMLLLRFSGVDPAKALSGVVSAKHPAPTAPKVELFIEADEHGRRRVIDPTNGSRAFSGGDAVGWAAFGLAWGAIVGFTGGGGILSAIDSTVVTGILWGIFGLLAGALYGLWAGRGVSARRLKRIGSLNPPGTSLAVAWAEGTIDPQTIERWTAGASDSAIIRFTPAGAGAVLQV